MILKCIGGPMDGAVYQLDKPAPNTNRKPDGLWFDSQEASTGRFMREEYKFARNADGGEHVIIVYEYDGQVVDAHSVPQVYSNPEDMEHDERPGIVE